MMTRFFPAALGVALIAVGSGAALTPSFSATMFGIPAGDEAARAYMRAAGVRDAVLGAIILGTRDDPRALRRILGWTSLIALADALALLAARGPRPQHAAHLGGFAALALAALAARP